MEHNIKIIRSFFNGKWKMENGKLLTSREHRSDHPALSGHPSTGGELAPLSTLHSPLLAKFSIFHFPFDKFSIFKL